MVNFARVNGIYGMKSYIHVKHISRCRFVSSCIPFLSFFLSFPSLSLHLGASPTMMMARNFHVCTQPTHQIMFCMYKIRQATTTTSNQKKKERRSEQTHQHTPIKTYLKCLHYGDDGIAKAFVQNSTKRSTPHNFRLMSI